jgi:hypothetical protein
LGRHHWTEQVALRKLGACLALTALGLLPWPVVIVLVVLALGDLDIVDDQVLGFGGSDPALLVAAGLVAIAGLLWLGVIHIAFHRILYEAHHDRSISIGQALAVGRRNLWRLVGAYLLIYLAALAVFTMFAAFGVALEAATGGFSDTESLERIVPALNLLQLVTLPLSFWLIVKLAFIPVAAAVAPRDDGLIRLSTRLGNGRFWPVLGRILLRALVTVVVMIPVQIVFVILVAGLGLFVPSAGNDISVGALLGLLALTWLVMALVVYVAQIFQTSGITRLYADLGGPVE